MKIGLTGQIGAGKSTVAAVFKAKGAAVIDADAIGREVVSENRMLRRQLVKAFGEEILGASGEIDRSKLAQLAFTEPQSTKKLNRLVHPYLLKELRRQIIHNSKHHSIVVVDAALLHLWRMERQMDLTIVVSAPLETRLRRMRNRKIERSDARKRDRAQLSLAVMKKHSDLVIRNSGSRSDLKAKALKVWHKCIAPYIDR